jgi:hypothetical protein
MVNYEQDSEQLTAKEYAQKKRKEAYEKYKEQQRKERLILKAKKEEEKHRARQEKAHALRALLMRGTDLE